MVALILVAAAHILETRMIISIQPQKSASMLKGPFFLEHTGSLCCMPQFHLEQMAIRTIPANVSLLKEVAPQAKQ